MKSRIYSSAMTCVLLAAWSVFGVAGAAANKHAELVPLIHPSVAQAAEKQPLSEFLDAEGRLAILKGFSGSLDPGGLTLVLKAGEAPRFAAKNAVDDDARWDAQFGVPIACDGRVNLMAAAADGRIVTGSEVLL